MSRFHDVTVLTRHMYRASIESALKSLHRPQPEPKFVYFDLEKWSPRLGKGSVGSRIYYVLWQKKARALVKQLQAEKPFDLLHHVSFAGFRYPTVIWGQGVPCIWGPVGGIESIPTPLLPWGHPTSFIVEVFRNLSNAIQSSRFTYLPKRAAASDKILVPTREMQKTFAKLGFESPLMPTIGLRTKEFPFQGHRQSEGPLRLLFVGKIIAWKGIELAIRALRDSGTQATLTLIGTGNYLPAAKRLAEKLGLGKRATFLGQITRDQVLMTYREFDAMLFPSLHDTGGFAVIEAMFNELPVICLDCGGPAVAVQDGCGIRVPIGKRNRVIKDLTGAIRQYDQDRQLLLSHGKAARESILERYDWDKKGDQMNEVYEEVFSRGR
jgi:glycosyltransferase involved in cell wall biosynthesis